MIEEIQSELNSLKLEELQVVGHGNDWWNDKRLIRRNPFTSKDSFLSESEVKDFENNKLDKEKYIITNSKLPFVTCYAIYLPKTNAYFLACYEAACVITNDKTIYPVALFYDKKTFAFKKLIVTEPERVYKCYEDIIKEAGFSVSEYDIDNAVLGRAGVCIIHNGLEYFSYYSTKTLIFNNKEVPQKIFLDAMVKFFGGSELKNVSATKIVDISKNIKTFVRFLCYKESKKKPSTNDKYANIVLKKLSYRKNYKSIFGKIEKVEENLCVLRVFVKNDTTKDMNENIRIFFDKIGSYPYKKNADEQYIKTSIKGLNNWNFEIKDFTKENVKGTCIEFVNDILNEIPYTEFPETFCYIMGNPIIEQLYKSTLKDYTAAIIKNLKSKRRDFDKLGKINLKEKSLFKKLGLNKYQFEKLPSCIDKPKFNLEYIKYVLDPNSDGGEYCYNYPSNDFIDISSIDNKTFDVVLKSFVENDYYGDYLYQILCSIKQNFGMSAIVKFCEKGLDKKTVENYSAFTLFTDYMEMIKQVKQSLYKELIRHSTPFYNDVDDLRNQHNLLSESFKLENDKKEAEALKANLERFKDLVFEDDTYKIILPKNASDFVAEGNKLHHCVASFTKKVAYGQTNVMFIRKKEEIDEPFFTVEIQNDKTIRQIHGFGNRNVDTEPGLDKFVKKWISAKKLKKGNINDIV